MDFVQSADSLFIKSTLYNYTYIFIFFWSGTEMRFFPCSIFNSLPSLLCLRVSKTEKKNRLKIVHILMHMQFTSLLFAISSLSQRFKIFFFLTWLKMVLMQCLIHSCIVKVGSSQVSIFYSFILYIKCLCQKSSLPSLD